MHRNYHFHTRIYIKKPKRLLKSKWHRIRTRPFCTRIYIKTGPNGVRKESENSPNGVRTCHFCTKIYKKKQVRSPGHPKRRGQTFKMKPGRGDGRQNEFFITFLIRLLIRTGHLSLRWIPRHQLVTQKLDFRFQFLIIISAQQKYLLACFVVSKHARCYGEQCNIYIKSVSMQPLAA